MLYFLVVVELTVYHLALMILTERFSVFSATYLQKLVKENRSGPNHVFYFGSLISSFKSFQNVHRLKLRIGKFFQFWVEHLPVKRE